MLKTARFTWSLVAALALAPLAFADDSARFFAWITMSGCTPQYPR